MRCCCQTLRVSVLDFCFIEVNNDWLVSIIWADLAAYCHDCWRAIDKLNLDYCKAYIREAFSAMITSNFTPNNSSLRPGQELLYHINANEIHLDYQSRSWSFLICKPHLLLWFFFEVVVIDPNHTCTAWKAVQVCLVQIKEGRSHNLSQPSL